MKRSSISILTLLFPCLLVGQAFAAWLFPSEKTSLPKTYDLETVLRNYFGESQSEEYTGDQLLPTGNGNLPNSEFVNIGELSFKHAKANDSFVATSSYEDGGPVNSGKYLVKVSTASGAETILRFTVSPKTIYIQESSLIEIDYSSEKRQFDQAILPSITDIAFVDKNGAPFSFSDYVVAGMDNGMYYYPNDEIKTSNSSIYYAFVNARSSMLTGTENGLKNVVGSTYAVTLTSTNKNIAISNRLLLKYKTALVGSTLYTVEDALANASSGIITFKGDSTSATSYVATSFCGLPFNENPYYSAEQVDAFGKLRHSLTTDMVVNYADGTSASYAAVNRKSSGGNVYSALILPSNVSLDVASGKTLTINAQLGYNQPDTSVTMGRGVILNEGLLSVSGKLKTFGYIKGAGTVDCLSGSEMTEVLRTFDWPGGNTASNTYKKMMPINAYSVHNCACKTYIRNGAKVYAEYVGYETSVIATPLIISSNSNDKCIFLNKSSSSYAIKRGANAAATPDDDELYRISGSNQKLGQKDIVDLYGSFSDSSFSISLMSDVSISTSTSIGIPIGFMDVTIKGTDEDNNSLSSSLSISKSDFIFLPGTTLTVEKNASITTASKADLIFETVDHIANVSTGSNSFYVKCVDKTDAKMMLNGTMTSNGSIGGLVLTESAGAKLVTGSGFAAVSFYSLHTGVGASSEGNMAYQVTNMYSKAFINNETQLSNFVKSQTYVSVGSYFTGTAGTQTNLDGAYNGAAVSYKPSIACILPNELITMADGSVKEIQHIEQGELILVFNHETGEFDVSPAMFNEVEEANIFNVIHLIFSDGSDIGVISEHGFFDLTTMRYEYIHEDNYQDYIGHEFYSLEGGRVMLLSAYVHEEYTAVYSMPTYYFLNSFTNGILSMPGATSYFSNIFAYAENLQYDQEAMAADIEQYGLLTLEDLAPYGVTEELFEAYAGKYLGIALAKGLITEEDLLYLIARYGGYYE